MKRVLGWALVVLALGLVFGVWTGLRAQRESASIMVQAGLAIAMGCNLLLFVWLWSRARPGSGDAIFSPAGALLSAAMLVGILPGLLWPAASGLRIAGAIASIAMTVVSLNIVQRRRRSLRVGGRV
jgi:hypothetical protein